MSNSPLGQHTDDDVADAIRALAEILKEARTETLHEAHEHACLERQIANQQQELSRLVVESSVGLIRWAFGFAAAVFVLLLLLAPAGVHLGSTEISALVTVIAITIGSSLGGIRAGLTHLPTGQGFTRRRH